MRKIGAYIFGFAGPNKKDVDFAVDSKAKI
jgi:hypothetical protein